MPRHTTAHGCAYVAQAIVKLQKKGSGAPAREPNVDQDTQKAMMAWYYKKQEEEKVRLASTHTTGAHTHTHRLILNTQYMSAASACRLARDAKHTVIVLCIVPRVRVLCVTMRCLLCA